MGFPPLRTIAAACPPGTKRCRSPLSRSSWLVGSGVLSGARIHGTSATDRFGIPRQKRNAAKSVSEVPVTEAIPEILSPAWGSETIHHKPSFPIDHCAIFKAGMLCNLGQSLANGR